MSDERSSAPPTGPGWKPEIERKYLLSGLPEQAGDFPSREIEQGWLPGGESRVRLRRSVGPEGPVYTRTEKRGRGVTRMEKEETLDRETFQRDWEATRGARVHKRRYLIPIDAGLCFELDEFLDRDLVLVEVELPDEQTEVAWPPWLAAVRVREVSGEPAYVNQNLAR